MVTATGFGVAFFHAAIPTHWLPFVAVGQGRGWSRRRTLGSVALAGGGHVAMTTALGVGLAWFGFELSERWDHAMHLAAGLLLVGLGAWLFWRGYRKLDTRTREGQKAAKLPVSDRAAVGGLFFALVLTPCEVFLPMYLSGLPLGWPGVVWLSVVLALATLGAMMAFTALALSGARRVGWPWLRRLDERAIGALLAGLGAYSLLAGH